MRLRAVLIANTLAIVGLPSCSDERRSGDPCSGESPECIDDDAIWQCEDGRWHRRQCADECATAGQWPPRGCLHTKEGDACACDDLGLPECSADEQPRCEYGSYLTECIDGERHSVDCNEICAEIDSQSVFVGCFYDPARERGDCSCARAGDVCDPPGYPTCVADDVFACGGDGRWHLENCDAGCPQTMSALCSDDLEGPRCLCLPN